MAAAKKGRKGKPGNATGTGRVGWSRKNFAPVLFLSCEEKDGSFKSAEDILAVCTSFTVKDTLTKACETKFAFRNDDRLLAEDPRFLGNTRWRFRFGYYNELSPIMIGFVRNIEPNYDDKMSITVTLYDASLNASVETTAKNWGKITSAEIAKKMCKKHGWVPAVEDSKDVPKKAWIQPNDVNDIRFLRDLAAMVDFEVYVEGSPPTLFYRKKKYDVAPSGSLTYFDDPSEFSYMKSFKPKVTNLGPLATGASGTDAGKGKGAKDSSKDPSKENPAIGGGRLTFGAERDSSGQTKTHEITRPVSVPIPANTDPKKTATILRQQLLDKSHEASSDHPLTASLQKGLIFVINGVEKPLQGKWYCQEVTHTISGTGAETKVNWKRNSEAGKGAANVNNKDKGSEAPKGQRLTFGGQRDSSGGTTTHEVTRAYSEPPPIASKPQPVSSSSSAPNQSIAPNQSK